VGLGISGTEDNAALYTQALRAVDGLCDTCATATDPEGNYFTIVLPVGGTAGRADDRAITTSACIDWQLSHPSPLPSPYPPPFRRCRCRHHCRCSLQASTTVTSVQLQTGETVEGAFIFLGESGSNNGMDNPVCAMVSLAGWDGVTSSGGLGACGGLPNRKPALLHALPLLTNSLFPSLPRPVLPPPPPQNVDLPANTASSVSCEGVGKYLTIATPKNLSLCDIYVNGWSSSPEPSLEPLPVAAEQAPAASLPTAEGRWA
jgi:hypothetical protein